ncbi:MAG: polysaccharide deacetylase family protein [Ardenticatenaceae bacterium]|nr:polysaccharide deacetylase family protein [Anaerolineales bacterium]MCB8921505.1 polysaccharide deacetylase family protein [Ardenticatenaceae bacterium]
MSLHKFSWLLILFMLLAACAAPTAAPPLPTQMPLASLPDLPTSTQTAVPTNTPQPTITAEATLLPTGSVTETAVPVTPLSPTPIPTSDDPSNCRSMAVLTAVQPQWLVKNGPWPRPAAAPNLLGRATDDGLRLIHLGFDVEGEPYFVGDLLDMLDRRQVKTTLFILGSWADTNPDWVQEMARRGHEMATHGYSHADMSEMTAVQIRAELASTEASVIALTGQSSKPWLRPPFGSYSDGSVQAAYAAGYTTVIWTGSSNDWRSGMDADKMCAALLYYAMPGAILYAHTNRADIVDATERFIAEMQLQGYTFVPLSILMADDPAAFLEAVSD